MSRYRMSIVQGRAFSSIRVENSNKDMSESQFLRRQGNFKK